MPVAVPAFAWGIASIISLFVLVIAFEQDTTIDEAGNATAANDFVLPVRGTEEYQESDM